MSTARILLRDVAVLDADAGELVEGQAVVVEGDRIADTGPAGSVRAGDAVTCTGGPRPARVVTFGPRDFHQILKAKFGLADR